MHVSITHYTLGAHPVTGSGLGMCDDDLDEALSGPVAGLVFDDPGRAEISELLGGVVDTAFGRDNLDAVLNHEEVPEDWRVGEALAECFLTELKGCTFPWPDSRDERKRGSSLPGADLVGFQREGQVERFAFGEVKTSAEATYPPSAAYGRHGLKSQMEDLRDSRKIRDGLVKYLGHRASSSTWGERYRIAAKVYLSDPGDVRIFGLLIRDVLPNEVDLRARVRKLGRNCPNATVIEMVALYLPEGRIATLSAAVMSSRRQGGAS